MAFRKPESLLRVYREYQNDPAFDELRESARSFVPAKGSELSDVMCVGEAPGAQEDRQGWPFVGPSGALLGTMLMRHAGIPIHHVYITNVVKYRPPGNRTPRPAEVAASKPYLYREVQIVDPKIVVLLGRTAWQAIFPGEPLGTNIGVPRRRPGTARHYVAGYHPAYILRNTQQEKPYEKFWESIGKMVKR